jgi:hypothetical protein
MGALGWLVWALASMVAKATRASMRKFFMASKGERKECGGGKIRRWRWKKE